MICFNDYKKLMEDVNNEIRKLEKQYKGILQCRPGCIKCCKELSVLPLEAEILQEAFNALSNDVIQIIHSQAKNKNRACPFLIENLCSVYQARPLICRTHGLPVGYVNNNNETIEVSACPVNFSEDAEFGIDDLLLMDQFNAILATLNEKFSQKIGHLPVQRISIRDIITQQPPSKDGGF